MLWVRMLSHKIPPNTVVLYNKEHFHNFKKNPAFLISNKQKLPVNITPTFKLKQNNGV